ncbi:transposase [Enterococcus gallinarum]|nr:transposase [Enterococcus gallinarum]
MCRILGLSRQSYYYQSKPKKDESELEEAVAEEFIRSRKAYGSRKIKKALSKRGIQISRRKISRIMKNRGLKSSYTVAYFKVHHSTCNEAKTTNVLNRKFLRDNPLEAIVTDLIEKMYGHHYTPQTMSNMTKSFTEEVTSFKERELHDRYAAIYMDATYIPLKRKTVAKEAIHIAVGIRPDGSKEVLSYAIAPTESIMIWEEILIDLQERGVKNVLLFITDGLKGMAGAVQRFYPKARFQHCCVHVSRNISHKVRVDDRKEVCDDFKMVYQASSKKAALEARGAFAEKWKTSYPKMVESILSNDYLLTFYDFPLVIRKTIYSTNLIESFNKQIKKYSHRKEQFQNEESMERFLVSSFDTHNQKFLGRSHKGFQQAEGELEQMLSQPMEN